MIGRAAVLLGVLLLAATASAAERYALIVTGASAGDPYASRYDTWRQTLGTTLVDRFGYPADHLILLGETRGDRVGIANRENVRAALGELRKKTSPGDLVLIVLIGHGTALHADAAKFNLVGPDLSAQEWGDLIKPIAARVVFVNTTSASFPFLQPLTGPERIVITATDSAQQQFETVFPEFFIGAFQEDSADLDRNGRVSIWEAFTYASARVRESFETKGQLATERPLLDDTGDGVGRESGGEGIDGTQARVTYLQPDATIPATGDAALTALLKRRAALEADLELVKARKPNLPEEEYERELEKVLLELARIERQIRFRS
jgi:hypothetical protein